MKETMGKKFVKPREGYTIRDPETKQPLPPEGAKVAMNSYYRRRLREGVIVVVDEGKPLPAPKSEETGKPSAGKKK